MFFPNPLARRHNVPQSEPKLVVYSLATTDRAKQNTLENYNTIYFYETNHYLQSMTLDQNVFPAHIMHEYFLGLHIHESLLPYQS